MKIKVYLAYLLGLLLLSSCIREEGLNAECDILSVTLKNNNLIGNPIIENDKVTFIAKPDIDLSQLAPEFELTPGATLSPSSGTERNFTTAQKYTVTSEDRKWKKVYTVTVNTDKLTTQYSFDHYEIKDTTNLGNPEQSFSYYEFYEKGSSGKNYLWASGNAAFQIPNKKTIPANFPTSITSDAISGTAAKLVTTKTGFLGAIAEMPIAAGNLFIGQFESTNAMLAPLKATRFGAPFTYWPMKLKGWYKYTPGSVFTDKHNSVIDKTDEFDIYAVFYEPTPEKPYLDGTNILTDESIIAIARVADRSAKAEYTEFDVNFEYKNYAEISTEKLKNYKYNLAIVFSSSIDGANFNGAVGSCLIVDEVELVYAND